MNYGIMEISRKDYDKLCEEHDYWKSRALLWDDLKRSYNLLYDYEYQSPCYNDMKKNIHALELRLEELKSKEPK